MKTCFTDNLGRSWRIAMTPAALAGVRRRLGIDLDALAREPGLGGLAALIGDLPLMVDVLFAVCEREATRGGVTDEDFGRALSAEAIVAGTHAFAGAVAELVPDPRVRAALRSYFRLQSPLLK